MYRIKTYNSIVLIPSHCLLSYIFRCAMNTKFTATVFALESQVSFGAIKRGKMPRSWFLIPSFNKRNQGSLERFLILGLGPEIYKVSLDNFVVTEK